MGAFESSDVGGTKVRMYVSGSFDPGAPGVVVLHAWWGLNEDVVAYVDRLAGDGFAVVAPDMFGGQVATTIEEADRLSTEVEGAADSQVEEIVLAAVDDLANRLGPRARLGILGFSFGAGYALWSPAERDRLVASVVYYGSFTGSHLGRSSATVLGNFAETDPYESEEGIAEFEEAVRTADREMVIHRYPGTGHWFAEPSRDAYQQEAADLAFERTVEFLRRQLAPPPV